MFRCLVIIFRFITPCQFLFSKFFVYFVTFRFIDVELYVISSLFVAFTICAFSFLGFLLC